MIDQKINLMILEQLDGEKFCIQEKHRQHRSIYIIWTLQNVKKFQMLNLIVNLIQMILILKTEEHFCST